MAAQEDSQVAESARSLQLKLNRSESKPFLVAKVAVSSPETVKSGRALRALLAHCHSGVFAKMISARPWSHCNALF
jgi:hypothetical protein